ncbi:hypothetical protein AN644_02525 [Candidatus Epulonipiscium fishelsonii]|nr:hypothetical protein AN644_02525 [Epulopiscium sp. SCG-C06WGA-EpuloA1]
MTTLLMGILLMMSPSYSYANEVIQPSIQVTPNTNITIGEEYTSNEQLNIYFEEELMAPKEIEKNFIDIEETTETFNEETTESFDDNKKETDEYLHITQPLDNTTTFDSQINMMGEATEGIEIIIVVAQDETYNLYDVGTVGATETFNQLIDLYEGDNVISVAGKHDTTVVEEIFEVRREPKENKNKLQNFVITGKEDLPSNLKTNNEEMAETSPETT